MRKIITQAELTAADDKIAAFDFQYYFFLWKILSLEPGQSIGWEVFDDIHIETANEFFFYQIKHTVQRLASNTPKSLSTFDQDLWKTISNWIKFITDTNADRKELRSQIAFVEKATFILATNKSSSSSNKFLSLLLSYKELRDDLPDFKNGLEALILKTQDNDIKEKIESLAKLPKKLLEVFLKKICFEFDESDIFGKCKLAIKADKVPESKIDAVFRNIDSAIRKDNFITVCNRRKVVVTFEDFYRKYKKYYDIARSPLLEIQPFNGGLPDKLEAQIFIRQLIDIEEVSEHDLEIITEFTNFKVELQHNLDYWYQNGEITNEEIEALRKEAILFWQNVFRSKYRNAITDSDKLKKASQEILDKVREKNLLLSKQDLPLSLCNGLYYQLSDEPTIGWQKDWEAKYRK